MGSRRQFLDTADAYSRGGLEKILDKALNDLNIHREQAEISTKVRGGLGDEAA